MFQVLELINYNINFIGDTMKKITKIVALAATVMSFFFTSCNNLSTDASVSGDFKQKIESFDIEVSADSDLVDFSSSTIDLSSESEIAKSIAARTITPAALDGTSGLKFYLGGLNKVTGDKLYATNVTFVSDGGSKTKGKVTVDLEPSNYSFTLVALLDKDVADAGITSTTEVSSLLNKAVLVGYANADLRYPEEASKVKFYLSSDGLKGTGSLSLSFYLDGWSNSSKAQKIGGVGDNKDAKVISQAEIKLTTYRSNTLVTGTDVTSVKFEQYIESSTTYSYNKDTKTTLGTLQAGTYNVVVTFTKDGRKYSYSDDVKILPSQETTATIGIPDLLVGAPEAPKNFTQSYADSLSNEADNYYVFFNWTDDSKTEQYFEIQVFDIGSTQLGTDAKNEEANWADSILETNTYSYGTEFYGLKDTTKPSWYAGSLQKNNTFAAFYMPLGKRYLARIRAVSEAGESAWKYATNITEDTSSNTLNTGEVTAEDIQLTNSKTLTGKKFSTEIINLYRISYMPNGGSFTGAQDTVFYFTQTDNGTPIMCPNGTEIQTSPYVATDTTITLKNENITWTNWKINQITGKTYPNIFEQATTYSASTLYYTTDTLSEANINGTKNYYKIASVQPTTEDDAKKLYVNTGKPENYLGYQNLVLYANYTENTFDVIIDNPYDKNFSTNYTVSVNCTGTGTAPKVTINNSGSCEINRTGVENDVAYTVTTAQWNFSPKNDSKATYSKITGELFELGTSSGDVSKGFYTANSNQIDMGLTSLKSGKYKVIFKGYVGSSTTPYTYTVYITLTD